MRTTESCSALVRIAADNPREIVGTAVPYGQVTEYAAEFGRESFDPGSFATDAAAWMSRDDGARLPYRPRHKAPPNGVVTALQDTPGGLMFRASIFDTQAGNEYLREVEAGLNGVSIEFDPVTSRTTRRGGVTVHREARLLGIAGASAPAYDGARVMLRDLEGSEVAEDTEVQEREAAPETQTTEAAAPQTREAAERATLQALAQSAGGSIRQTVAPRIYGREAALTERGDRALFMRDAYQASIGDRDALERQQRHYAYLTEVQDRMERAGDFLVAEGPGLYPNDYLPGLTTPRIMKGRPMADSFLRVPVSDARPRIFGKITTSGSVVTAADGAAFTATDIASTSVTVTPAIYAGYTDISRAVFDGLDPAADQIVFQDLVEAYSQASEAVVKTAVEAGATASGVTVTAATPWAGVLGNVINYYGTRFKNCQVALIPAALYAVLAAQGDSTGRPYMPMIGAYNSDATINEGGGNGGILGASTLLSWSSTANVCVFARREDYVVLESPIVRFTFEQAPGTPAMVRVGVWAYIAAAARLGGLKATAA